MTANSVVMVILATLLLVLLGSFVMSKSAYSNTIPSLEHVVDYEDALTKAAEFRRQALEQENKRTSAEAREAVAMEVMKREASIKAMAEADMRILINAAEAHENLAEAHRALSNAKKPEIFVRRTPLIVTEAHFPATVTNCVADKGNSLLLPQ